MYDFRLAMEQHNSMLADMRKNQSDIRALQAEVIEQLTAVFQRTFVDAINIVGNVREKLKEDACSIDRPLSPEAAADQALGAVESIFQRELAAYGVDKILAKVGVQEQATL